MLRERAKANRRKAILDAAARMFAERAYRDVVLEDVAAAADVAKGTVYLYFQNKEQLYLTLIQQSLGPFVDGLKQRCAAMADAPAMDVLAVIVGGMLDFLAENPAFQDVVRLTSQAAREAVLKEHGDALAGLIHDAIGRGVQRGELLDHDPDTTTQLVLAMVKGCPMILAGNGATAAASVSPPCLAKRIVELVGHGLLRHPDSPKPSARPAHHTPSARRAKPVTASSRRH